VQIASAHDNASSLPSLLVTSALWVLPVERVAGLSSAPALRAKALHTTELQYLTSVHSPTRVIHVKHVSQNYVVVFVAVCI
jgi:hypothetical protein